MFRIGGEHERRKGGAGGGRHRVLDEYHRRLPVARGPLRQDVPGVIGSGRFHEVKDVGHGVLKNHEAVSLRHQLRDVGWIDGDDSNIALTGVAFVQG